MNKMKMLFAVVITLGLSAHLFADYQLDVTIAEYVIEEASDTGEFSTLVAAVVKAGLVDVLDGKRQFTVFAPDNQAFDDAAGALGFANGVLLVDALSPEALRDVLLYHVSPGERFSDDVLTAQRVRTMSKEFLFVDGITLSGYTTASIQVAENLYDISVANGVIHVIDFVLLSEDWVDENL